MRDVFLAVWDGGSWRFWLGVVLLAVTAVALRTEWRRAAVLPGLAAAVMLVLAWKHGSEVLEATDKDHREKQANFDQNKRNFEADFAYVEKMCCLPDDVEKAREVAECRKRSELARASAFCDESCKQRVSACESAWSKVVADAGQ